jgi:rod shape-determining protein MreC
VAWPSRQSWSSWSRRDRNRALWLAVASGLAVILGFLLLLGARADPAQGRALRVGIADASAPAWNLLDGPASWLRAGSAGIARYRDALDDNAAMRAEADAARRLAAHHRRILRENAQLRAALRVVEPKRGWFRVVAVSAATSGSFVRSAVVAGGAAQGLGVGQPVRGTRGLIGRIVEVGRSSARVLLLTDAASRVPVRVVRTGRAAMAAGVNAPALDIRYTAPADDLLRVGDMLVTSGDGGIFPPDVPVARVIRVNGDLASARPFASAEGLGYVIVEQPWLPPLPVQRAVPVGAR